MSQLAESLSPSVRSARARTHKSRIGRRLKLAAGAIVVVAIAVAGVRTVTRPLPVTTTVVQEGALAAKDFPSIEKSAGRIGYSEQMSQMCTHMGAGAPGFTDAAITFHRTADTIAEAAKKRDADAVLSALSRTLATCTSCHATFKQHVVDDATWSSLAKQAAPSGPEHP